MSQCSLVHRQVAERHVSGHPLREQRVVVDQLVGRPVAPGDELVAATRVPGLCLQGRDALLVGRELQVAPGLQQVAGPAVALREGAPRRPRVRFVDLGDQLGASVFLGQPGALVEQQRTDTATPVVGVHGHVHEGDRRVVLRRQYQPQGTHDDVLEDRGPMGAVTRSAGREHPPGQGHVVTDRPRQLVRAIGELALRPDPAPVGEPVVVALGLHEAGQGGHPTFLPAEATEFGCPRR